MMETKNEKSVPAQGQALTLEAVKKWLHEESKPLICMYCLESKDNSLTPMCTDAAIQFHTCKKSPSGSHTYEFLLDPDALPKLLLKFALAASRSEASRWKKP